MRPMHAVPHPSRWRVPAGGAPHRAASAMTVMSRCYADRSARSAARAAARTIGGAHMARHAVGMDGDLGMRVRARLRRTDADGRTTTRALPLEWGLDRAGLAP